MPSFRGASCGRKRGQSRGGGINSLRGGNQQGGPRGGPRGGRASPRPPIISRNGPNATTDTRDGYTTITPQALGPSSATITHQATGPTSTSFSAIAALKAGNDRTPKNNTPKNSTPTVSIPNVSTPVSGQLPPDEIIPNVYDDLWYEEATYSTGYSFLPAGVVRVVDGVISQCKHITDENLILEIVYHAETSKFWVVCPTRYLGTVIGTLDKAARSLAESDLADKIRGIPIAGSPYLAEYGAGDPVENYGKHVYPDSLLQYRFKDTWHSRTKVCTPGQFLASDSTRLVQFKSETGVEVELNASRSAIHIATNESMEAIRDAKLRIDTLSKHFAGPIMTWDKAVRIQLCYDEMISPCQLDLLIPQEVHETLIRSSMATDDQDAHVYDDITGNNKGRSPVAVLTTRAKFCSPQTSFEVREHWPKTGLPSLKNKAATFAPEVACPYRAKNGTGCINITQVDISLGTAPSAVRAQIEAIDTAYDAEAATQDNTGHWVQDSRAILERGDYEPIQEVQLLDDDSNENLAAVPPAPVQASTTALSRLLNQKNAGEEGTHLPDVDDGDDDGDGEHGGGGDDDDENHDTISPVPEPAPTTALGRLLLENKAGAEGAPERALAMPPPVRSHPESLARSQGIQSISPAIAQHLPPATTQDSIGAPANADWGPPVPADWHEAPVNANWNQALVAADWDNAPVAADWDKTSPATEDWDKVSKGSSTGNQGTTQQLFSFTDNQDSASQRPSSTASIQAASPQLASSMADLAGLTLGIARQPSSSPNADAVPAISGPARDIGTNLNQSLLDGDIVGTALLQAPLQPQPKPTTSRARDDRDHRQFKTTMRQKTSRRVDMALHMTPTYEQRPKWETDIRASGIGQKVKEALNDALGAMNALPGTLRLCIKFQRHFFRMHNAKLLSSVKKLRKTPGCDPSHLMGVIDAMGEDVVLTLPALSPLAADANLLLRMKDPVSKDGFWIKVSSHVTYEFNVLKQISDNGEVVLATIEVSGDDWSTTIRPVDPTTSSVYVHCPQRMWDYGIFIEGWNDFEYKSLFGAFTKQLVDTMTVTFRVKDGLPVVQVKLGAATDSCMIMSLQVRLKARSKRESTCKMATYLDVDQVSHMNYTFRETGDGDDKIRILTYSPAKEDHSKGKFSRWYEASLSSMAADKLFAENKNLGLGQVAPWTVKDLESAGVYESLYIPACMMMGLLDQVGCETDNGQTFKPAEL